MRFFVVLLLLFCSFAIKAQTDGFLVYMDEKGKPNASTNRVQILLDENSTDALEVGKDGQRNDYGDGSGFFVSSLCNVTDDAQMTLSKDSRPYLDRLYVDYPFKVRLAGTTEKKTYSFRATGNQKGPTKAVFVRLIDNENPSVFHWLAPNSDYEFTFQSPTEVTYKDRFVVRVYLASVLKKEVNNKNWTDEGSWYGGIIPGKEATPYANYNVIIPENASVLIPTSNSLIVGKLYISGSVSVETGSSLTIESGLILDSTEIYY